MKPVQAMFLHPPQWEKHTGDVCLWQYHIPRPNGFRSVVVYNYFRNSQFEIMVHHPNNGWLGLAWANDMHDLYAKLIEHNLIPLTHEVTP